MLNIDPVPIIDVNTGKLIKQWKMQRKTLQDVEASFKEKIDAEIFIKLLRDEGYIKNIKMIKSPHPDGGYQYTVKGNILDFDRNKYWAFNADALAYGGCVP